VCALGVLLLQCKAKGMLRAAVGLLLVPRRPADSRAGLAVNGRLLQQAGQGGHAHWGKQ
jgi:hypothetical protein